MKKDGFQFKRFSIKQDHCAMKVGTDGVLLGAWCDVTDARHILDVGAGSGLVALMVAQRNYRAIIEAVEIDRDSASDADYNFKHSPWSNRLNIKNIDFLDYRPSIKFDLIVSNPPFFDTGIIAPDSRRAMARHTTTLPFNQLFSHATELLAEKGRIAIVAPIEAKEKIEFLAGECNLWMQRRAEVRTKSTKPVKRILWEFVNYPAVLEEESLILQSTEGGKTDEYTALTSDFYL